MLLLFFIFIIIFFLYYFLAGASVTNERMKVSARTAGLTQFQSLWRSPNFFVFVWAKCVFGCVCVAVCVQSCKSAAQNPHMFFRTLLVLHTTATITKQKTNIMQPACYPECMRKAATTNETLLCNKRKTIFAASSRKQQQKKGIT